MDFKCSVFYSFWYLIFFCGATGVVPVVNTGWCEFTGKLKEFVAAMFD